MKKSIQIQAPIIPDVVAALICFVLNGLVVALSWSDQYYEHLFRTVFNISVGILGMYLLFGVLYWVMSKNSWTKRQKTIHIVLIVSYSVFHYFELIHDMRPH